jgi:putative DNA primase/helicase
MNQDPENVRFLQRMLGYSITGLTVENKIFFMQGKGRNGKSTILATLSNVLGNFTWCIESTLFTEQKFQRDPNAPTPALLSIRGRRIVYASETGANASMNTEQLKRLSSADMITARPLNVNKQIEFIPTHQLVLSTNHLPAAPAKADDYAIWDRMIVFPLPFSFIEEPREDFEKKVDKYLLDKLRAEAPGILAWLVRGCLEWQREGLKLTDSIIKTTQQYERGEDELRDFIDEWCELGATYEVQAKTFYEAFCAWFKEREPSRKPMSNKRFGAKMGNRFDRTEDSSFRYYLGVRVREECLSFSSPSE